MLYNNKKYLIVYFIDILQKYQHQKQNDWKFLPHSFFEFKTFLNLKYTYILIMHVELLIL